MVRDTDEDDVWPGTGDLFAAPSRRALRLAGAGADSRTERAYAPPREAIGVLQAGVEEAAVAWRARRLGVEGQVRDEIGLGVLWWRHIEEGIQEVEVRGDHVHGVLRREGVNLHGSFGIAAGSDEDQHYGDDGSQRQIHLDLHGGRPHDSRSVPRCPLTQRPRAA